MARILACDAHGLRTAGAMLREGGVVAFPTETVYGLGANALDEGAVLKVFRYKGRPLSDPLIVHVPGATEARKLLQLPPSCDRLFDVLTAAFWPGPLTVVSRASKDIPMKVTADTGFVGVRVPRHALALALLREAGVPIAAPSANRFGHVSPTRARHVFEDLGTHPIGLLDAEGDLLREFGSDSSSGPSDGTATAVLPSAATPATTEDASSSSSSSSSPSSSSPAPAASCEVGIESTVLRIDESGSSLTVFRPGGVSLAAIDSALRAAGLDDVRVHVLARTVSAGHAPAPASSAATSSSSSSSSSSSEAEDAAAEDDDGPGTPGEVAPGQLLTHYAPDVPTYLLHRETVSASPSAGPSLPPAPSSSASASSSAFSVRLSETVVLDFGGWLRTLPGLADTALAYRDLAPSSSVEEAQRGLFEALRWAEQVEGAKAVVVVDLREVEARAPSADLVSLEGLRDRLFRAASGRTLVWREDASLAHESP